MLNRFHFCLFAILIALHQLPPFANADKKSSIDQVHKLGPMAKIRIPFFKEQSSNQTIFYLIFLVTTW